MPKECDCSVEERGLPTLYPYNHNYCFVCGKKLKYISEAEFMERMRNIRDELE